MNFSEWLTETLSLQEEAFNRFPTEMGDLERADWFMMNLFAINTEVTELSDELGWKPWVSPRGWINRDQAIGEVVDMMHFIGNILVTLGDPQDVAVLLSEAYYAKLAKNRIRQSKNDDGVSRRCTGCRRSLDDVGISIGEESGEAYCSACGEEVSTKTRRAIQEELYGQ